MVFVPMVADVYPFAHPHLQRLQSYGNTQVSRYVEQRQWEHVAAEQHVGMAAAPELALGLAHSTLGTTQRGMGVQDDVWCVRVDSGRA
jgi:hypothetical protein